MITLEKNCQFDVLLAILKRGGAKSFSYLAGPHNSKIPADNLEFSACPP